MATSLPVDPEVLRRQVQAKYRDVAITPGGSHHFHTGRPLVARLGYDTQWSTRCPTGQSSPSLGSETHSSCAVWRVESEWSMSDQAAVSIRSSLPVRWDQLGASSGST